LFGNCHAGRELNIRFETILSATRRTTQASFLCAASDAIENDSSRLNDNINFLNDFMVFSFRVYEIAVGASISYNSGSEKYSQRGKSELPALTDMR